MCNQLVPGLDIIVNCDITERDSPSLAHSFPDFAPTTGQERTPRD